VPVLQNEIAVRHRGTAETTFTNQAGPPLVWKASFSLPVGTVYPHHLVLDGKPVHGTIEERGNRQSTISVSVPLSAGQTRTVTLN
jgi:hypothetical protein